MKIQAFTSPHVFEALRPEWNALLQNSQQNYVFLTHEWQSTWWQAYHPGELWVLTLRDEADNLQAIFPWFIHTQPEKGRIVRWIGCVEVTDYLGAILQKTPGRSPAGYGCGLSGGAQRPLRPH
ncbi:MAG: hypothetical protein HC915_00945 [Anaerolineae bacterium]|nr:hypothetical protein [Anaerolineae bacterium]